MRTSLALAALLAAPAPAQIVSLAPAAPAAMSAAAGGAAFRPAARDWSEMNFSVLGLTAGRLIPSLPPVQWEDPASRAVLAPLLARLEARALSPEAFTDMNPAQRDDETFGAVLEARELLGRAAAEYTRLSLEAPPGDPELPRAVARLDLLRGLYAPYLSPADRDAVAGAYARGLRKLTEQQAASISALSRRIALALGTSAEEERLAAVDLSKRPEVSGYFKPGLSRSRARVWGRAKTWEPPKPNAALMAATAPLARWMMFGAPVLRRVSWLRDVPFLRGYFRLQSVDIPEADAARLRAAVLPSNATFLSPAHPEVMTDLLIDKEIAARFAPRMAHFASAEFARKIFPWFWSRNNLVVNDGGRASLEWTADWALSGQVASVHGEGGVHWTGDRVHPIYPGLAEMALYAASRALRPVLLVPLVWKLVYQTDIASALHKEMDAIERAFDLPRRSHDRGPIEMRFFRLQDALMRRQMRSFGYPGDQRIPDFFVRQQDFREWLIADLLSRRPVPRAENNEGTLNRINKAIAALPRTEDPSELAVRADDRARVAEARRLGGFSSYVYNTPLLTQEQMYESLKRIHHWLRSQGLSGLLRIFFPRPLGPRIAHVRVAEPIPVSAAPAGKEDAARDALLKQVHGVLQDRLDALNAELAHETSRFARPNPFYIPPQKIRGSSANVVPIYNPIFR